MNFKTCMNTLRFSCRASISSELVCKREIVCAYTLKLEAGRATGTWKFLMWKLKEKFHLFRFSVFESFSLIKRNSMAMKSIKTCLFYMKYWSLWCFWWCEMTNWETQNLNFWLKFTMTKFNFTKFSTSRHATMRKAQRIPHCQSHNGEEENLTSTRKLHAVRKLWLSTFHIQTYLMSLACIEQEWENSEARNKSNTMRTANGWRQLFGAFEICWHNSMQTIFL